MKETIFGTRMLKIKELNEESTLLKLEILIAGLELSKLKRTLTSTLQETTNWSSRKILQLFLLSK